jgi:membrane protease YdiL (CAAX protease family)
LDRIGRDSIASNFLVWSPVAVLVVAALVPSLRIPVALATAAGWGLLRARGLPEAIAWAAVLPVAFVLPWPIVLGADAPLGEAGCIVPASPIVLRRLLVAGAGLLAVVLLARIHRSSRAELGLRRPGAREAAFALGACLVVAVAGLYVGPWLAGPFFGRLEFPVPAAALLPAVVFGIANGVLEEVQYRGAMQAWLGRVMPWQAAIVAQGLVFGVVHAGPEVLALLPVHIAVMGTAGVGAGLVRRWTGSLWLPIGIHGGADIALYVGLACRAAA